MFEIQNSDRVRELMLTHPNGEVHIVTVPIGGWFSSGMPDVIERDTKAEIMVEANAFGLANVTTIKPLPSQGEEVYVDIYIHNGKLVYCRQQHWRTEHEPEDVPALFYFVRENPEGAEWIEQEMVSLNDTRTRNGKTWKVLQPHVTQAGWEPENTPALWQEVVVGGEVPVWVQPTGGHDAYNIGDEVMFPDADGTHYRSLINANVWSPTAYPAGWEVVI